MLKVKARRPIPKGERAATGTPASLRVSVVNRLRISAEANRLDRARRVVGVRLSL
jgi:hypothetical protein